MAIASFTLFTSVGSAGPAHTLVPLGAGALLWGSCPLPAPLNRVSGQKPAPTGLCSCPGRPSRADAQEPRVGRAVSVVGCTHAPPSHTWCRVNASLCGLLHGSPLCKAGRVLAPGRPGPGPETWCQAGMTFIPLRKQDRHQDGLYPAATWSYSKHMSICIKVERLAFIW